MAVFAHYPIGTFLPYAGVSWLRHDAPHDVDGTEPASIFVPTLGLAWHFDPRVSVCVEARWFDVEVNEADYMGRLSYVDTIRVLTVSIGIQAVLF